MTWVHIVAAKATALSTIADGNCHVGDLGKADVIKCEYVSACVMMPKVVCLPGNDGKSRNLDLK